MADLKIFDHNKNFQKGASKELMSDLKLQDERFLQQMQVDYWFIYAEGYQRGTESF